MVLFEFVAVLAAATMSLAATVSMPGTPPGFQPATQNPLVVLYINGIDATGGKQVGKDVATKPPLVATAQKLPGSMFAVMMVDLDVPAGAPPQTTTMLHWMQTGLVQSQTPVKFNTTLGVQNIYPLQMPGAVQPVASYIGPQPLARTPLNHRYTLLAVDISGAPADTMNVLAKASQTRMGFNPLQVLTQANLQSKVVAGDYFRVTSPGPAHDGGAGTSTPASSSAPAPAPAPAPSAPQAPPPAAPPPNPITTSVPSVPSVPTTLPLPAPSSIPSTVPVASPGSGSGIGGGFGTGSGSGTGGATPSSPFSFGGGSGSSSPTSPFSFGGTTQPGRNAGTSQKPSGLVAYTTLTLVIVIFVSL